MSIDRAQKLLRNLGIPISQGSIQAILEKVAARVKGTIEEIKHRVEQLPVAHFDETGLCVAGQLY